MGMHECLMQRGSQYEVTPEFQDGLSVYKGVSDKFSKDTSERLSVSILAANQAIAPTGSIGILAGTSTRVEGVFAVAYKKDTFVETTDEPISRSLTPLPKNSSIATEPLQMELKGL
jgi:ribonucleoside-diphosphate reductase alpha chain